MPREMVRGQLINGGGSIRDNLELPLLPQSCHLTLPTGIKLTTVVHG